MASLENLHKLLDPEIRAKNLREARHWLRGAWWDLSRPSVPDPVFVVGCSRSGTTVTYETLAASGRFLAFGWEIPQFWDGLYGPLNNGWESEAAGAEDARPEHRDAALRYFYQRLGRGQVLDKTCINTLRLPYLYRLFPAAKFVFIQRDGRDNVSSMIEGGATAVATAALRCRSSSAPFRSRWRSTAASSPTGPSSWPPAGTSTTAPR